MSINESQDKIINDSAASIKEEFFGRNIEFVNTNIDSAFKAFSNQIFGVVNTTFSNINSNYEKSLEINRENHERVVEKLSSEVQQLKLESNLKQDLISIIKDKLSSQIEKFRKRKMKFRLFRQFKENYLANKNLKIQENIVVKTYFYKKRFAKIFSAWKNIAHSNLKSMISAKYSLYFNMQYEEKKQQYSIEIDRLTGILKSLENSIIKEVDERKKLSSIYDQAMSRAANTFINETQQFKEFNTSNVQTPKERGVNSKVKGAKTITY